MADNWTREQTIVAFNLYCKIPFSKVKSTHPEILKIANIIGRNANAVKMKIGNFGSFDPSLANRGIVGLRNASKLDVEIWDEFNNNWNELTYQSEAIIAKLQDKSLEDLNGLDLSNLPAGKERESILKVRVNQNFFRNAILSSYNDKCCVTGLNISELLIASHIMPWRVDTNNRTNPQNGLCLNALHDKAFDRGLITITKDYRLINSRRLAEFEAMQPVKNFFLQYESQAITLPEKFRPGKQVLEYHNDVVFIR